MTDVVASSLPTGDVFALTAALVDIASESFNEQEIVAVIEAELRACPHLTVDRIGDNLICLLYTSPSPRDRQKSRMPSSA